MPIRLNIGNNDEDGGGGGGRKGGSCCRRGGGSGSGDDCDQGSKMTACSSKARLFYTPTRINLH